MKTFLVLISLLMSLSASVVGQQTIFNVPSGDVLDRGKVYGELDYTYQHSSDIQTFTPRVVVGIGHRVEAGVNFNGFTYPGKQSFTPTPTIKWKLYDGKANGWVWLVGDDVFIPAQSRTHAGNYVWTEAARSWKSGTRATFGIFHFTPNVVGTRQKVGGQFAIEQAINSRLSFATDWFTGDSSTGYVTPGAVLKVTRQLTWYASYQIGNHDLTKGNHQLLFELGWNFN